MSGARRWVYPRSVSGQYQRLHRAIALVLHVLLFVVPWIQVNGHPAFRINLPARRLYLLGMTFTTADGYLLVLLGLMAAFSLFFFTSLFGRLWCGYLCPQTVLLEEWVRPIEMWLEGDRAQRIRRDRKGFHWDATWRKAVKFGLFALVALAISSAFQSLFADPRNLWTGNAGPVDYALVGIFATGWFFDFVWFREQLCNFVCPYARFQGALTDEHSLVVSYDAERGEPREPGKQAAKDGRCVDCNRCVEVCPAGIDIRDGFQLECITCGRCIDACHIVQAKVGHPTLIKYTTLADDARPQWIRPRTVVYSFLLTAVAAAAIGIVVLRAPFEAGIDRVPGSLYTEEDDGVRNTFFLNLVNNSPHDQTYTVELSGLPEASVDVPELTLKPEEARTVPMVVHVSGVPASRTTPFSVIVFDGKDRVEVDATFKAPAANLAEKS